MRSLFGFDTEKKNMTKKTHVYKLKTRIEETSL